MHMIFYHTHSAIYAYMDSHKGPWTKYKVSSFDKLTYSQILPNVVKNQCIFLVIGCLSYQVTEGRGWVRATEYVLARRPRADASKVSTKKMPDCGRSWCEPSEREEGWSLAAEAGASEA
jgi:hypothetical protein